MNVPRIILAEDDPLGVELTLAALAESGLADDVLTVGDGEELLDCLLRRGRYAALPKGNPAVILLDLKMPRVDGLEALRHIRAETQLAHIPVVMLTSSREEGDLSQAYRLGASAYVVKPVDFSEFTRAVKHLGLFWALFNEPPPGTIANKPGLRTDD